MEGGRERGREEGKQGKGRQAVDRGSKRERR